LTLRYTSSVDTEPGNWVEENFGLIVAVSVPFLVVLVGMGLAIWYMFCRARKDHEHLARIIEYERRQKKKKHDLLKGRMQERDLEESSSSDPSP
jgi:hypothetical protein